MRSGKIVTLAVLFIMLGFFSMGAADQIKMTDTDNAPVMAQVVKKRDNSNKKSIKRLSPRERIAQLEKEVEQLKAENAKLKAVIYDARKTLSRVK